MALVNKHIGVPATQSLQIAGVGLLHERETLKHEGVQEGTDLVAVINGHLFARPQ